MDVSIFYYVFMECLFKKLNMTTLYNGMLAVSPYKMLQGLFFCCFIYSFYIQAAL